MLHNKEGFWMSDEKWNFKCKDGFIEIENIKKCKGDLIYIENINKTKVLETTSDGKVILEDFEDEKAEQLWEKGEPNDEGYFTLENYKVAKFMTYVISSSSLEVKGNII